MNQHGNRMPATGEGWRHYKGDLYTVVGIARDESGNVCVVYTNALWGLIQFPPLYTQPLGRFLQDVENDKPRFRFEREAGHDPQCPFIQVR